LKTTSPLPDAIATAHGITLARMGTLLVLEMLLLPHFFYFFLWAVRYPFEIVCGAQK
jgi:hypothetical protein